MRNIAMLWLVLALGVQPAGGADEPIVAANSDAIRAFYRQRVGSDFDLLVARQVLAMAKLERAVREIDLYMADRALLRISGGQVREVPATLERLVQERHNTLPVPAMTQGVLEWTVRVSLATSAGESDLARPETGAVRHRRLAPALWASYDSAATRNATPSSLHVLVFFENSSKSTVEDVDADLRIELPAGPLVLSCRQVASSVRRLEPGAKSVRDCVSDKQGVNVRDLTKAVEGIARDPIFGWRLFPTRTVFADPRISVTREGIVWLEAPDAAAKARRDLAAMTCEQRGASCGPTPRTRTVSAHPVAPRNVNDPIVMRDSEGIREVYRRPVGSDFDALIAREMLALAQDEEAVKALDLYLAESALGKLSGEERKSVPATIETLVRSPASADNADASIRKILAATLRPKLASIEHPEKYLPNARDNFQENRELTPDLWASHSTGQPKDAAPHWLHLFIRTENTSANAVSQFDADLHIDLPAGPLKLRCKEPRFTLTPLPPGAATLHDCGTEGHRADLRQLTAAVDTIRKGGSGWTLVPSRINFVDPPVGLSSRGVYWLNSGEAAIKAREAIAAMSCQQRGSCAGDFGRALNANPQYVVGAVAVVAGVIAGWLIGLFARRPAKTASLSVGAIITIAIGILVVLGMTLTGMDALIVVVLAIFGAFGVAGLVIGLLVGLALGRRRQKA